MSSTINYMHKRHHNTDCNWLQNPKDQTAEDLTNVRCDICRTFKKRNMIT